MASRSTSRSRTADTVPSKATDASAILNSNSRLSPTPTSSTPTPISPESRDQKPHSDMISTVTRQSSATPLDLPPQSNDSVAQLQNNMEVDDDDRSSSLSELEDASDQLDAASADHVADQESDYDTEAETERLERTPQKLNAPVSNSQPDKSPSKLAQEVLPDDDSTPTANGHIIAQADERDESPSRTLFQSNGDDHDREESPSRKRKRSESAVSSLSDADEPLAKRAQSARYQAATAISSTETLIEKPVEADQEDGAGEAEVDAAPTTERDQELEAPEPTVPVKGRKGRKGKRKGRRAANDDVDTNGDDLGGAEEQEADEEEEDSNRDEEIAKKKLALDAFTKIEKEFAAFREKHIKQQLAQISQELDLLRQPTSTHPEFLANLKCIDDYRDEKIRYQDVLFRLKQGTLQVRTVSERQQLHSQYFQEVRDSREKTLEQCYEKLYAIQKDRRRWGADDANYAHLYQPKRALQIAHQTAYNLEVSILSGVAKHVGFPAAPVLPALQTEDIDSDFKVMRIQDRPLQPRISLRDVERNAAEKSFYEQNAWADPSVAHMVQSQAFATPVSAPSNRIVSNGSTIDGNASQLPTPQHMEAVLSGKVAPQLDSSPLGGGAAGPSIPSVLSATAFPTSGLHGAEAPRAPSMTAMGSSISVGGGGSRGFVQ